MKNDKFAGYLGIDQYGNKYILNTKHPRKALLEQFGAKHCEKIYRGLGEHCGYFVKGHWITLYKVFHI